ncbi:MAG: GIY-YIG nuclease family protein [Pseudomonadota bacterium]
MKLRELNVLVLDCQATKPFSSQGTLLELAWGCFGRIDEAEKGKAEIKSFLIRQDSDFVLKRNISYITGIKKEDLLSARSFEDVLSYFDKDLNEFCEFNEKVIFLAHFARYEKPFIEDIIKNKLKKIDFEYEFICTHEIVKRLIPALPRKGLRACAGYFAYSVSELRRAEGHVIATKFVWNNLIGLLEEINIYTLFDLLKWLENKEIKKVERQYNIEKEFLLKLPEQPGIYKMFRSNGDLLYIGKAKSLKSRVKSYFQKSSKHAEHILEMLSQAKDIKIKLCKSEIEAAIIESDEIKEYSPPYNKALKENRRKIVFYDKQFQKYSERPSSTFNIGPFLMNESGLAFDSISSIFSCRINYEKAYEIFGVENKYAPDMEMFKQGVKEFRKRNRYYIKKGISYRNFMEFSLHFFKDRLAKEDDDCDYDEDEDEQVIVGALWDVARVSSFIEGSISHLGLLLRRANWFLKLIDSLIEYENENIILIKAGRFEFIESGEKVDLEDRPNKRISKLNKMKCIDLKGYDRMRIITSELKSLLKEDANISIKFTNNTVYDNIAIEKNLEIL